MCDYRFKGTIAQVRELRGQDEGAACPEQPLADKLGNEPNFTTTCGVFASYLEATV